VSACAAAGAYQAEWASLPAPPRGDILRAAARLAERRGGQLVSLIRRETGKLDSQARYEAAEFARTCDFFSVQTLQPEGPAIASDFPHTSLLTARAPLGVSCIITCMNYPAAIPIWSIAPALACGNTVVWKSSEETPGVSHLIYEIFREANLPKDAMQLVFADAGSTHDGLSAALDRSLVAKAAFTGTTANGRLISCLCASHLQVPMLQLSGNNVLVVAEDADLEAAVQAIVFSGFGVNQGCTTVGNVLVHESIHNSLLSRLDQVLRAAAIGDPAHAVVYGPTASDRYAKRFEQALDTISSHHQLYGSTGVGRIQADNPRDGFVGDPTLGSYYHPVVVDGARPDDELMTTEVLGPLIAVASYDAFEQAVAIANETGYGLIAAIYTHSAAGALEFRDRVPAGLICINRPPSLASETRVPFGGQGRSGNGSRLCGPWSVDQFTRWQAVSWCHQPS
jgi:aldehyde dehydrogenase (NAD+)